MDNEKQNGTGDKTAPVAFSLTTGLDYNTGISLVKLRIGSAEINLIPDASAQIALELLSASYKARAMADLYRYAKEHNLSMKDLGL